MATEIENLEGELAGFFKTYGESGIFNVFKRYVKLTGEVSFVEVVAAQIFPPIGSVWTVVTIPEAEPNKLGRFYVTTSNAFGFREVGSTLSVATPVGGRHYFVGMVDENKQIEVWTNGGASSAFTYVGYYTTQQ